MHCIYCHLGVGCESAQLCNKYARTHANTHIHTSDKDSSGGGGGRLRGTLPNGARFGILAGVAMDTFQPLSPGGMSGDGLLRDTFTIQTVPRGNASKWGTIWYTTVPTKLSKKCANGPERIGGSSVMGMNEFRLSV